MKKLITVLFLFTIVALVSSQSQITTNQKKSIQQASIQKVVVLKDTVKKLKVVVLQQEIKKDTVADKMGEVVLHKKNAHASYYADKFHGKRTAKWNKLVKIQCTTPLLKFGAMKPIMAVLLNLPECKTTRYYQNQNI